MELDQCSEAYAYKYRGTYIFFYLCECEKGSFYFMVFQINMFVWDLINSGTVPTKTESYEHEYSVALYVELYRRPGSCVLRVFNTTLLETLVWWRHPHNIRIFSTKDLSFPSSYCSLWTLLLKRLLLFNCCYHYYSIYKLYYYRSIYVFINKKPKTYVWYIHFYFFLSTK